MNAPTENCGTAPSDAERRELVKSHFFILQKNFYNYHNPDLNKQVVHKSMTFVCECANFKIENTVAT